MHCARKLRDIWIIAGFALLVWGGMSGLWDLQTTDECRYVQVARELCSGDNLLRLTINNQPYDQKPPLAFWTLAALLHCVDGIHPGALRLPSVLAAVGITLLVWRLGLAIGGRMTALAAALVFMTTPLVLDHAPKVRLDMIYAWWTTLAASVWLLHRGDRPLPWCRALLMWGAAIAGFFTKGPLLLLILASLVLCDGWWRGRVYRAVRNSRMLWGLCLVVLAIGIWLALEALLVSPEFVSNQIFSETAGRASTIQHAEPVWFYLTGLLGRGMCPWIYLLIPVAVRMYRRKKVTRWQAQCLGWFAPVLILLLLVPGKRMAYLLPLIPPLALLIGHHCAILIRKNAASRVLGCVSGLLGIVCSCIGAGFALLLLQNEALLGAGYVAPADIGLMTVIFSCSVLFVWSFYLVTEGTFSAREIFFHVTLVLCVGATCLYGIVNPLKHNTRSNRNISMMIGELFDERGSTRVIGALDGAARPRFHVYGDYRVRDLSAAPTVRDWPRLVICQEKDGHGGMLRDAGYHIVAHYQAHRARLDVFERH